MQVFSAARIELVLVEVLGTLVAWLLSIGGLQRSIAVNGSDCPFDTCPFNCEQFSSAIRVHKRRLHPLRRRFVGGGAGGYFLAGSKYGLVPEAWSVTSTTRSISETASVIATSMPWLRVTVAMPQPWHPPPRRR